MNWQTASICVVMVAIFLPWLVAELRGRKSRHTFRSDPVARKHRAVVRRGFKSRMGVR